MGGGDQHRHLDARVGRHVLRERERQPVDVQVLVGPSGAGHPARHADYVALDGPPAPAAGQRFLGHLEDSRPVQELEKVRVAIEDALDVLLAVAAVRAVAVEALLPGFEPVHRSAELGYLVGVQDAREVDVAVSPESLHTALDVGVGHEGRRLYHPGPPESGVGGPILNAA